MTSPGVVKPSFFADSKSPSTRKESCKPRLVSGKASLSTGVKTPSRPGTRPASHRPSPTTVGGTAEVFLQRFNEWKEGREVRREVLEKGKKLETGGKTTGDWQRFVREVGEWKEQFTGEMKEMYAELVKDETPSQLTGARQRLLQACSVLSQHHLTTLKSLSPPLPDLEALGSVLLSLLHHLNPPASKPTLTWKSLLTVLSDPVPVLSQLKNTPTHLENSLLSPHFLLSLKEKLAKISLKNLKDFDRSGTGSCLHTFLHSLISYSEALQDQQTPPFPLFSDVSTRGKLLNSLYERVFYPGKHSNSQ